jgi:hypothetical protein
LRGGGAGAVDPRYDGALILLKAADEFFAVHPSADQAEAITVHKRLPIR